MEEIALSNESVLGANEVKIEEAPRTNLYKPEIATQAAKRRRLKNDIKGWLFSVWPFLGWVIFAGIPFVVSIFVSFLDLHHHALLDIDYSSAWTLEKLQVDFQF